SIMAQQGPVMKVPCSTTRMPLRTLTLVSFSPIRTRLLYRRRRRWGQRKRPPGGGGPLPDRNVLGRSFGPGSRRDLTGGDGDGGLDLDGGGLGLIGLLVLGGPGGLVVDLAGDPGAGDGGGLFPGGLLDGL